MTTAPAPQGLDAGLLDRCPLCLAANVARLGIDKRGNPYIRCSGCGATAFCPTPQATTAIRLGDRHVRRLLDGARMTVPDLQRRVLDPAWDGQIRLQEARSE